jgi:hypothetical protein
VALLPGFRVLVEDMVGEVPRVSLIIPSYLMMFGVVMHILGHHWISPGVMGVRVGLLLKMRAMVVKEVEEYGL